MFHKPNNFVNFQNFLSMNNFLFHILSLEMLNLAIFKHKSEKYWNKEIAQGVLGNYALVSQTCSISLSFMFCTRHWRREKMFDPFILPKIEHWIWHFFTFCIFL